MLAQIGQQLLQVLGSTHLSVGDADFAIGLAMHLAGCGRILGLWSVRWPMRALWVSSRGLSPGALTHRALSLLPPFPPVRLTGTTRRRSGRWSTRWTCILRSCRRTWRRSRRRRTRSCSTRRARRRRRRRGRRRRRRGRRRWWGWRGFGRASCCWGLVLVGDSGGAAGNTGGSDVGAGGETIATEVVSDHGKPPLLVFVRIAPAVAAASAVPTPPLLRRSSGPTTGSPIVRKHRQHPVWSGQRDVDDDARQQHMYRMQANARRRRPLVKGPVAAPEPGTIFLLLGAARRRGGGGPVCGLHMGAQPRAHPAPKPSWAFFLRRGAMRGGA